MERKPFKPYCSLHPFDLDEYKGSFDIWLKKWNLFLALSTIDSALHEEERDEHKCNVLLF
ncbi:hypothetical protein T11_10199 [Trichinella zimbabwensis]|uniref:Uncharacterized protein n=1 Tax=Trichinella zimbabwensis TaxID=268475 RepID=A0A0V1GWD1_9BILA|nr:hypothetical protein T11_10199 [Trichinella zimbabwensis]